MNSKPLLICTIAVLLCPAAFAQKPADKPFSESDLLKQIEALTPPGSTAAAGNSAPKASLFDAAAAAKSDPKAPGDKDKDKKDDKPGEKKAKGPTEITALQATFDQKANLAVFIGDVVVKDPEFNVNCDRLTAHLKHDDKKAKPGTAAATPTPKPATPAATPAAKAGSDPAQKKSGGLEKAVAESTSDRRVIITQDKTEADGTITHSIGRADKATYDATTGDVVLTGSPDVIQGINRVQATAPETVITLNRDGHMKAVGPHKTTITEKSALQ